MHEAVPAPRHDSLIEDLKAVRRAGLTRLRKLELPALETAVQACGYVESRETVDAAHVEILLREAVAELSEGAATVAGVMFGLTPGTRGEEPSRLRQDAAQLASVSVERFRHKQEPELIEQCADVLLRMIREYELRRARLGMEHQTPVSSRLAIHWVERFEAYYALWTCILALGGDLTAYRSTRLEPDRPYDREPTEQEPKGYTQELQAAGYGTDALFHFAGYLYRLEQFIRSHGGLWLFHSKQVENEIADAVQLIRLYAPTNEQDDSYLRACYCERAQGELDPFRKLIASEPILNDLHAEWQEWLETCECTWQLDLDRSSTRAYFPTYTTDPGISDACMVHTVIKACGDYCLLIDDEWDRIADWYRLGEARRPSEKPEDEYWKLRERHDRREAWPPWGEKA
jgi:hypothetical protein